MKKLFLAPAIFVGKLFFTTLRGDATPHGWEDLQNCEIFVPACTPKRWGPMLMSDRFEKCTFAWLASRKLCLQRFSNQQPVGWMHVRCVHFLGGAFVGASPRQTTNKKQQILFSRIRLVACHIVCQVVLQKVPRRIG